MTARVVVADDSLIVRAGLIRLLESGGFRVVAEAGDLESLRRAVGLEVPDVAVVDIRMPPTYTDEGLRAATAIRREHPETAVLVVSHYVEVRYAMDLLAGDQSKVGYLLKDRLVDRASLLAAVWRVCTGEVVVDPAIVDRLIRGAQGSGVLAALSDRELEVLALMAEGLTDRGIAERLGVSPKTVASHVLHVFERLGVENSFACNKRVRAVLTYLQATRSAMGDVGHDHRALARGAGDVEGPGDGSHAFR